MPFGLRLKDLFTIREKANVVAGKDLDDVPLEHLRGYERYFRRALRAVRGSNLPPHVRDRTEASVVRALAAIAREFRWKRARRQNNNDNSGGCVQMAVKNRRNCKYCGAVLGWSEFRGTYVCPRCHWEVDRETARLWRACDVKNAVDENKEAPVVEG